MNLRLLNLRSNELIYSSTKDCRKKFHILKTKWNLHINHKNL